MDGPPDRFFAKDSSSQLGTRMVNLDEYGCWHEEQMRLKKLGLEAFAEWYLHLWL